MRIAAVFTGGTIGSVRTTDSVTLDDAPPRLALSAWQESHPDQEIEFTVSEPFRILSEDAGPTHWDRLARHIRKRVDAGFEAIVVFHGSDTLPWTASALAFALQGLPIPLLLVAADTPLDDPSTNGHRNLEAALEFLVQERLPGVFTAWANPSEEPRIYLGTRLRPAAPLDDTFSAPRGLHFGTLHEHRFVRHSSPANPTREEVSRQRDPLAWTASCRRLESTPSLFAQRLLVLPPHPGLDTGRIPIDQGWQGILQIPFHSATAPSLEGEASVLDLARRARDKGIPFLLGPCVPRQAPYDSTMRLLEAGVRLLPAMTLPAAQVKLMFLLGTQGHIAGFDTPLSFEQI
ncbi:MAG: asparaginase [Fibrobacteria bacterium]|nr:asparaginase [Fibrobacteria bacterium]